jgi:hypothetical protein
MLPCAFLYAVFRLFYAVFRLFLCRLSPFSQANFTFFTGLLRLFDLSDFLILNKRIRPVKKAKGGLFYRQPFSHACLSERRNLIFPSQAAFKKGGIFRRRPFFRHLTALVVSVEKPNSHKYDEPKGKRVLIAVGVSFDTGTRNFFMVKPTMKAQLELK